MLALLPPKLTLGKLAKVTPLSERILGLLNKLSFSLLLLPIIICVSDQRALAQAGIQPFGTYSSDFDSVNVGTLSVHYDIPLFTRKERGNGTDISVHLVYDGGSLSDGFSLGFYNYGWQVLVNSSVGGSGHVTMQQVPNGGCPNVEGATDEYYTYMVTDNTGHAHYFASITKDGCTGQFGPPSLPMVALDGSGYLLTAANLYNYTIVIPSGAKLTCVSDGAGDDDCTTTDSNGNLTHAYYYALTSSLSFSDPANSYLAIQGGFIGAPLIVSYKDTNGAIQQVKVIYQQVPVPDSSANITHPYLPATVQYPDNSSYSFSYEPSVTVAGASTARLASVTLPTGGTVGYTYTDGPGPCGAPNFLLSNLDRTTSDGTTHYYHSYPSNPCSSNTYQTTITDSIKTAQYTFVNVVNGLSGPLETSHSIYAGTSISGSPIETVTRCYNGMTSGCETGSFVNPVTQITTVTSRDGGPATTLVQKFNASSLPTETDEYDYGASTPTRKTLTTYASLGNYISDRVQSRTIKDGNDNIVSQVTYGYDEGTLDSTQNLSSSNHVAVTGSRGNRTSQHLWLNTSSSTLDTKWKYDDAGQVTGMQDPKLNWTYYAYDPATDSCLNSTTYPLTVNGYALVEHFGCDANTGVRTSSTDFNGTVTTFPLDAMLRSTGSIVTNGGTVAQTTITYSSGSGPKTTTIAISAAPDPDQIASKTLDGYGRVSQEVLASGAKVDTTYNALGQVSSVTNPYFSTPSLTDGTTTYSYDALGRKRFQCHPDNGNNSPCAAGNDYLEWRYNSNVVTSYDEARNTGYETTDVLGRLTNVVEPGGNQTDYSYDVLGDLWNVTQHGASGETPSVRSFTYDSLSRLLCTSNPENSQNPCPTSASSALPSGVVKYSYDPNGNVSTKTDARGNTINYTYDALNRLTFKNDLNGTFVSAFGYDGNSASGAPLPQNYLASTNAIGRLSYASNYVNADIGFGYDAMGRITTQTYCLPDNCGNRQNVAALYDLAGNMADLTYPDGRHIKQAFDSAGRLSTSNLVDINGLSSSGSYLQSVSYSPDGSPSQMTLGNGVQQATTKNNRLQVQSMTVSSSLAPFNGQSFLSHTYCYVNCATGGTANNGNIWGISDTLNTAKNQGFSYDSLNRITSFSLGGVASQAYTYYSFGNMSPMSGANPLYTFDMTTNRINNLPCGAYVPSFDAAGNQLCDTDPNGGTRQYGIDAENRISQITILGGGSPYVSYVYGGDGARVRKSNADGTFTDYVNFGGQVLAQKDQTGAWTDYIYASGKKIAMVQTTKPVIHIHGVQTQGAYGGCGTPWYVNGQPGTVFPYVVQTGDVLSFDHKAVSALSGVWLGFGSGTYNNGTYSSDLTDLSPDGNWHYTSASLSAYAGQTATALSVGPGNPSTPVGPYDAWIANVVIQSQDGSVHPLFTGGSVTGTIWNTCGNTNLTLNVESTTVDSIRGTTFYLADHLGSAQLEFSGSGAPISSSQFTPFGAQLNPQVTANHYKFTGKERDSESGNDYFGARYYGSSMGRFMSPDWSAKAEPVPYSKLDNPQSLNLYSYVLNNPLNSVDPDGHSFSFGGGNQPPDCTGTNSGFLICQVLAQWNAQHEVSQSEWAKSFGVLPAGPAQQQSQYGKQADGSYKADPAQVKKAIAGGKAIGSGECVALCRFLSGAPNSGTWTAGQHAAGLTDADIGTAIATFDSSGHYPSDNDPLGKNSAIFMGRGTNGSIWVVDQWPVGDGPPGTHQPFLHEVRNYAPDNNVHPLRSNNADAYYVIRVP